MMFLYILSLLYLAQIVVSRSLTERDGINKKIHEILIRSERKNADPSQFTWIDRVQADIESSTQDSFKTKTAETIDIDRETPEPVKNYYKKNALRLQDIISDLNRIYSHSLWHNLKENGHTTRSHKANHSSKTRTRYKYKTTQPLGRLQKYSNGTDEITSTTSSSVTTESMNKGICRNRLQNIEKYLIRSAKTHPKESAVETTEETSTTHLATLESPATILEASSTKLLIKVTEPQTKDTSSKEAEETIEYTEHTVTKNQNTSDEDSFKPANYAITSTTAKHKNRPKIKANIDQSDEVKINVDNFNEKAKDAFSYEDKNRNAMELYNPKSERLYVTVQEWRELNTIEEEIHNVPNYVNRTDTFEEILHKIAEEIPLKVTEHSTETQLGVKGEYIGKQKGATRMNLIKMGISFLPSLTAAISNSDDVPSLKITNATKPIADTTDVYLLVNQKDKSLKGCFTIQAQPNKDKLIETTSEYDHSSVTSITTRNAVDDTKHYKQKHTNDANVVQNQNSIIKQNKLKVSKNENDVNSQNTNSKIVLQKIKGNQPQVINLPNVPYVTHVKKNESATNVRVQDLYKEIFTKDKLSAKFKKLNEEILTKDIISGKSHMENVTKISKMNQPSLRDANERHETYEINSQKAKEPSVPDDTHVQGKNAIDSHKSQKAHANTNASVPETANVPQDVEKTSKKKISDLYKEIKKKYGSNNSQEKYHEKIMKHMNWKGIKKIFGHDRVCNCKCKPNKTMCRACAASDAVMRELTFEFTNLAQYMKDHCTEIQTYFWMNPSGGKKLRDSVHRIDKSLNDYYRRIKGKCEGRTCETFATYLDRRRNNKGKN